MGREWGVPTPVDPEQNYGGPFQASHSQPGRGGGVQSQCVKKAFTWWECGILEEDWGRKKMSALLKNEVSSCQDFLLIFPETPKIKHFFFVFLCILRWSIHKNNSFGATDSIFAVNQVNVDDWGEGKAHVNHTHTHTHMCMYNKYTEQIQCLMVEAELTVLSA